MTPALLLALALIQPAPETAAPVTAPAAAVPTNSGAPVDDYGYVAWCRGALTGHMDMLAQVRPAMARVRQDKIATTTAGKSPAESSRIKAEVAKEAERDAQLDIEQQAAGQQYLELYKRALAAAEEAGASRAKGIEATGQGYRIWSAARASDDKTRMYSYLMWELPGRCETAAKTLEERSGLFGEAFKRADATPAPAAPGPDAVPAPAEAPPPTETAPAPSEPPPAPVLRGPAPAPGA